MQFQFRVSKKSTEEDATYKLKLIAPIMNSPLRLNLKMSNGQPMFILSHARIEVFHTYAAALNACNPCTLVCL